jgi:hypothetical protein
MYTYAARGSLHWIPPSESSRAAGSCGEVILDQGENVPDDAVDCQRDAADDCRWTDRLCPITGAARRGVVIHDEFAGSVPGPSDDPRRRDEREQDERDPSLSTVTRVLLGANRVSPEMVVRFESLPAPLSMQDAYHSRPARLRLDLDHMSPRRLEIARASYGFHTSLMEIG